MAERTTKICDFCGTEAKNLTDDMGDRIKTPKGWFRLGNVSIYHRKTLKENRLPEKDIVNVTDLDFCSGDCLLAYFKRKLRIVQK